MKKNELKDRYYQLSENIFSKGDIKELIVVHGRDGYYWWSFIELELLKNNGVGFNNWRYYSTNEDDKEVIEYVINMHEKNEDGRFSSIRVNEQLEERRIISERQKKRIDEYWNKKTKSKPETKPEPNKNEKVDLDELDGIKKSGKKKKIDDDEHDDIYI